MTELYCYSCESQLIGLNDRVHNIITCPKCHYRIRAVGTK